MKSTAWSVPICSASFRPEAVLASLGLLRLPRPPIILSSWASTARRENEGEQKDGHLMRHGASTIAVSAAAASHQGCSVAAGEKFLNQPSKVPIDSRKAEGAAVSRLAVSRKSIVCPAESTARYRYLSRPFTLI